jgi:hypothetical protein
MIGASDAMDHDTLYAQESAEESLDEYYDRRCEHPSTIPRAPGRMFYLIQA